MTIEGLFNRDDLRGLLRVVSREFDQLSVPVRHHEQYLEQGWKVLRVGQQKVQLQKIRPLDKQLELAVWKLLYDMGFPRLSGDEGVILRRNDEVHNQIDVVAHDDEAAVVVECKASESGRRLDVQAELAKLAQKRDGVRDVLNRGRNPKLKVGAVLAVRNVVLTEHDYKRAATDRILLLDYEAIQYYVKLAKLVGTAARYQLLGEIFAGQDIEGLKVKLPAVEARMGEFTVYHFAITPADLLKISYIAHRARNNIGSYQRMIQPKRLIKIREYIDDGGVFPTNIVINFTRGQGRQSPILFEQGQKDPDLGTGSRLGHITLPPKYHSAWIIDGQHRVLAYSGHRWATKSTLTVTAFDGLEASAQADLFVRINSEQRKVPASHLEALFATLNWNSDDPRLQVRAIISQAVQDLRQASGSVFADRILLPDEDRTERRCITLKGFADALKRPGLFIKSESNGVVRQYGILWFGEPDKTLARVKIVLEAYFGAIVSECSSQWDLADGDGGLVATNRGVTACIRILTEALERVRRNHGDAVDWPTEQLAQQVQGYGLKVGQFFDALNANDVAAIRQHYGAGAPTELAFRIADFLSKTDLDFEYPELDKWRLERDSSHIAETESLLEETETRVREHVVAGLKATYGEEGWWKQVPTKIRVEAAGRREQDGEDRPIEMYLQVMDFKDIVEGHWTLFEATLGIPKAGNKVSRTKWFTRWHDVQSRASLGAGARLKPEDYRDLENFSVELASNDV